MKTVDKLLTSLVTLHSEELKNSLAYRNSRILFSLCKSVNGDSFITENQSKLLVKIFKENEIFLSKLDDEFQSVMNNPTWSQPFRPQDTTKKLYTSKVDDDSEVLVIEFAFSSAIRKKITSFTKQITGLVQAQNGRMFYAEYTEKNIVKLVEDLKEFNFDIEEKLMDFYKTIKSWEKSTFLNQFMLTNITHDNFQKQITADLGIDTSIDQNIIKDRSIRYQYFTEKSKFDENQLTEYVANRRTTKVWVNRMTTSFDSLLQSLKELKRLPVLLVFDAFSSRTCANELKEISEILEKNGIFDDVGIYFRLDNSEDGKEFNQIIKDKKYNCQLTTTTKVVGVQSGKIPKFLLKTDWKPMSVIFIGTSLRNSKTAVYASNCDLVIAYTDKEPIIEAKAMWE